MKKHILIIATAIVSMALASCHISIDEDLLFSETVKGDGNVATREYTITQFDELSCSLPAIVYFTVGDACTCTVSVDENLYDYIEVKVKDGELLMRRPQAHKRVDLDATKFVINVTAPSLDEVNFAGSGELNFLSPLNTEELEVNVAGSANVYFNDAANVDHLELNVAGSGRIVIEKGSIRELEADIAGSGTIKSYAQVQDMDVNVAGSGDMMAVVNGTLDYSIAGSGNIRYFGDAKVDGKVLGSGSITRVENLPF